MAKRNKYQLPPFNLEKLLQHIQKLVDNAPGGVVQLFIDLFCGAGGTSEGIEQAVIYNQKCSAIIAGINHDKIAIYSQYVNHPLAYYTDEDIRLANLAPIVKLVKLLRKMFPQCPIFIWASLECTNHSNAKGGLARDPDSRTLPWDLERYIPAIKPDGIWIENVKEFSEWGPMFERVILAKGKTKQGLKNPVPAHLEDKFYQDKIEKGFTCYCPFEKKALKNGAILPEYIPIKDLKGTYYLPWKAKMDSFGYHNQERILNAADFGAPTNRKRLFLLFMKKGWPITFPHPTHAKSPKKGDLFDPGLKPHVPVKTCLDFTVEGRSVFEDGHVESDKTWERVYEGLVKFVAGGRQVYNAYRHGTQLARIYETEFLTRYNNNANGTVNRGSSVNDPSPTVMTVPGLGLIKPYFLTKLNSSHNNKEVNKGSSVDEPAPTIAAMPTLGLVKADFITKTHGKGFNVDINGPSPTVATKDQMALVSPRFILNYQGQSAANSIEEPSPTLMTKEKLAMMDVKFFLYRAYSAGGFMGSTEEPDGTVTTNPKTALMQVEGWIMDTHYENLGHDLNDPAHTITANRKWSYLINPSWFGSISSTDNPAVTIIARQDKAPIYLLSVSESKYSLAIPVFNTDPEIVVKIKEFMALYNIYDIKKRMLLVPELLQIQSFPVTYYLGGSKTDQKRFIGNAVPPVVARAIAEANYLPLVDFICKRRKINLKRAA